MKWRGRTTAPPTSSINAWASTPTAARRVGLRGVVAHARQPSGERDARKRHHRNAGRPRAGGLRASRPRVGAGRIQQWQQRCAVVRRRLRGRPVWRGRHDPQRARAVAHGQVLLLHRAAAIARAPPEYVRPRELHGRDRRRGESGSRRVPAAPSESSAIDRRVEGSDEGGKLGCTAVAEAGHSPNRRRRGRGVSLVAYEGDNGYCAMVAEVAVDQDTGAVTVKRIVLAQDCGPISNPDGMRNQIEGGVLQGMSRALMEEVTWDDQKVTSVDWRSYGSWTGLVGSSDNRVRSHQPPGRGGHRSGGDRHHDCGRRDRERDLRCDGSPRPPGSVHSRAGEGCARRARLAGCLRAPPKSPTNRRSEAQEFKRRPSKKTPDLLISLSPVECSHSSLWQSAIPVGLERD